MSNKQHDTAVIIESQEWRVRVYLGLAGLIVLTILAFVFRWEAGIIALAVGLAAAGRIALVGYHRHKLAGYERRKIEAETAKLEAEAIAAHAAAFFVSTPVGTFKLPGVIVDQFYPAVSASKLLADLPAPPPLALPEPARLRRLLDVYPQLIHVLVTGPSGAGKSTVLAWLIEATPASAKVIVLDPHSSLNRWPARAGQPIGTGRNWGEIDHALTGLIETMNRRYNEVDPITPEIYIVCDEWLSVLDRCPTAGEFFKTVGSEARKVGMHLVISSISATVDDLAQSAAVRDNLCQIVLTQTGRARNQAELKMSRKESETIELPGPYRPAWQPTPPPLAPPAEFEPVGWDSGPVAPLPPETELQIVQLYNQNKSLRAISREVFGSVGGRQAAEIKATLEKMGVSESVSDDVSKP